MLIVLLSLLWFFLGLFCVLPFIGYFIKKYSRWEIKIIPLAMLLGIFFLLYVRHLKNEDKQKEKQKPIDIDQLLGNISEFKNYKINKEHEKTI